ncbi:MAG: hypothetical protein ACHQQQ_00585 [Bacteroidota bacterium]
MIELENKGYYPLNHFYIDIYVPSHPGVYALSLRLTNGAHDTFYSGQSDNLYRILRAFARKDPMIAPEFVIEHLENHKCYFTYFVIQEKDHRNEIEKMLKFTTDPVAKLKLTACT